MDTLRKLAIQRPGWTWRAERFDILSALTDGPCATKSVSGRVQDPAMPKHSPEDVADFFAQASDTITTWARYRAEPDGEGVLVHMPPGEGERFKPDTRAGRYRCVLPSCDGLLEKNAHHWQHRSKTSIVHSPETLWHLTAKWVLADFAGLSDLHDCRNVGLSQKMHLADLGQAIRARARAQILLVLSAAQMRRVVAVPR